MDKKTFEQAMMKLVSQFGGKQYSQDRINLIFEEVKNISHSDLMRVIDHLLGNSRTAPIVADFRKTISELRVGYLNVTSSILEPNRGKPNIVYNLDLHYFANNEYIFNRSGKNSFVIKRDEPDHPMVVLDKQIGRDRKIEHLRNEYKEINKKFPGLFVERDYINSLL